MSLISQNEDDYVLLLRETDFPAYFQDLIHPEDYKIFNSPFIEKIFHKRIYHNRMFIRMCFKVDNSTFIPLTFIIDTGSPMFLYLCPKALEELSFVIKEDELGIKYINVNGKKFTVDETPHSHRNVNIIGLMALNNFGLYLKDLEFEFENLPEHF